MSVSAEGGGLDAEMMRDGVFSNLRAARLPIPAIFFM